MFITILLLLGAGCVLYFTSFRIGSGCWVRALCRAGNAGRRVALTFDDGPHAEFTPQVLDVLGKYGAEACFFLVGERIDPELLLRMDAEGHIVGNHTFSHQGMGPFASS